MNYIKELFTKVSMFTGLLFLVFTSIDGLFYGWNSDTTIYALIAVVSLMIFIGLELYFAPEDNDI